MKDQFYFIHQHFQEVSMKQTLMLIKTQLKIQKIISFFMKMWKPKNKMECYPIVIVLLT